MPMHPCLKQLRKEPSDEILGWLIEVQRSTLLDGSFPKVVPSQYSLMELVCSEFIQLNRAFYQGTRPLCCSTCPLEWDPPWLSAWCHPGISKRPECSPKLGWMEPLIGCFMQYMFLCVCVFMCVLSGQIPILDYLFCTVFLICFTYIMSCQEVGCGKEGRN